MGAKKHVFPANAVALARDTRFLAPILLRLGVIEVLALHGAASIVMQHDFNSDR
jgi:hypothetical protein